MNHTIIVTEATYAALSEVAKARGVTLDTLIETLAQESLNQRTHKDMDEEAFLRYLGASDEEIAAPIEEDDASPDAPAN